MFINNINFITLVASCCEIPWLLEYQLGFVVAINFTVESWRLVRCRIVLKKPFF